MLAEMLPIDLRGLGMPLAEYRRLLTEAYDLDKPNAPPDELARWLTYARGADGPVLEVMCGSGRFLAPLARAGIDIDGIDASIDMLAACSRKCAAMEVVPLVEHQLVQDLDLPREYALEFIAAGSFGLLVDEYDCRAALRKLFEQLRPGGLLVLEAETPPAPPARGGRWFGRWWDRPDGAKIVSRELARYNPTTRIEEGLGIYELYVDGRLVETELNDWVRRFWTRDDLGAELEQVGFRDTVISEDGDGMLLAEAHRPR